MGPPRLTSAHSDPSRPPLTSYAKRIGDKLIAAPLRIGWHDGDPDTPRTELVFDVVDDQLGCVSVTVTAPDNWRPLTRKDLSSVDIGHAREAVAQAFTLPTQVTAEGGMTATLGPDTPWPLPPTESRRNLRASERREDRASLEEVAAVYKAAEASGAPTAAVSEHFGISHRTAGVYIQRARRANPPLLPPYKRGKNG